MSTPNTTANRSILPLLGVSLAFLLALAPLLLVHARRTEIGDSMQILLAADQRSRGGVEQVESMMANRVACLVLLRFDGIFSDAGAALVHELGEELAVLPGVPLVYSLTRAERPVRAPGFSLKPEELIAFEPFLPLDPTGEAEWRRIEELVRGYPWARDLLVSRDGRWTMLVAEIARPLDTHAARVELRDEVEAIVAPFRSRVDEAYVGAFPFIEAEIREDTQLDVRRFLLVLPVLLVAILLATFRSWQVLLCVLVLEAVGVGLVPVLFHWNGATVNIHTGILFPLVAGLQLTFLTHLFSALRWAQRKGLALAVALPVALRHVLRPSAIAALTTVVGLLSLLACDVELVRSFGWLGAQAVVGCFAATFVPPLVLSAWMVRRTPTPGETTLHASDTVGPLHGRLAPLVGALGRHRGLALAVAGALLLACVPALWSVRTDLRAIEFLHPESDSYRAMSAVNANMGGMNLYELEVDSGRPGGIQEPEVLRFLERLEAFAVGVPGVTNVYGYAQVYAMLNEIWQRDAEGSRRVPESPTAIAAMGLAVHRQDFLFQDSMYDADRQRTTVFIRTRDMPAVRYLEILEEIQAFAEAERPEGVAVGERAGLHSVLESDRRIVSSQIRSLALCVASVFAILCVLWRSPRLAAVVLLANMLPLAAGLALHGYAGIPLNSVTVMVGAMVLGIAVDNGIHLLSFWKQERGRFEDPVACASWVLAHKLGPIACTTAVLVSGFGLFLFSRFPPLADFGVLAIVALLTALASTVLVLPPLLLAAEPPYGVAHHPADFRQKVPQ